MKRATTAACAALLCVTASTVPAQGATLTPVTVSSLSSTSGPLGGHGRLTVHGSGFTAVTAVLFGGAKAGSVHVVSSHTLTLVVPAHKAAHLSVRILTGHGESAVTKHSGYAYVAAPVVKAVSSAGGAGQRVTVKGSGFTHVKKVLFGKVAGLHVHVLSGSTLTVTTPTHSAGRVDVRVVSAYGTSKVKPGDRFTYPAATVVVAPPPPVIATTALPAAERGQPYTSSISVTSGQPPYTVTASGLPAGLSLSSAGAVSGKTFAVAGTFHVAFTVTDALGRTGTASLPLTVNVHAGQVYGWGQNQLGQVGNGVMSMTPVPSPVALPALTNVVQVVAGGSAGYALRADGTVYAWGNNDFGQLGHGPGPGDFTPQQMPGVAGVTALAAGGYDGYALRSDGTVLAWGFNNVGQLGDGSTANQPVPQPVPGLTGIVALASASFTAYAVTADGRVWSWGANQNGELGSGSNSTYTAAPALIPGLTGVRQVVARGVDVHALLSDGTVVGWGYNAHGEVGDTSQTQRSSPVPVYGLSGVRALSEGFANGYALLGDGTVRAWGLNVDGEIGDGTTTTRLSPQAVPGLSGVQSIAAGGYNAYATAADGTVTDWGWGLYGGNGDGTTANVLSPTVNPALAGLTGADGSTAGYAIR